MERILIFGNSGAGKSTLAKMYSVKYNLSHLDLDTIAWNNTIPPTRKSVEESNIIINKYLTNNPHWVIEGGYSDLLSIVINKTSKLVFLNPGEETCINNCTIRPWEPHKYDSMEEQNKNLNMLINWAKEYYKRNDVFSFASHNKLYNDFTGKKVTYTSNQKNA